MADQHRNPTQKSNGLKPLPKPVKTGHPGRTAQPRPVKNRPAAPAPSQPTLGEAFIIFLRRSLKKRSQPNQPRPNRPGLKVNTKIIGISALGVVCVTLIVLTVWSLTNKNAYAVYLADTPEPVGYIAYAKDIDEAAIQTAAVSRLESALGASVQVNETVSVKPAHSARSDILSDADIIDLLSRGFTYKIAATAIYVEGREITVLKTKAEAEAVEKQLQEPYLTENTKSAEFVEDWEYVTKLVDQEELGTAEAALLQLDKKTRAMADYVIQSGDTLGKIAQRNNTTLDKICADNPGYTADTILRVGNSIKLETTKPYLSVKTTDEIVRKESIAAPVKNVDNPNEYITYTKVIQEGRDGEQEVTVRIIRVNGIQTETEQVISTNPIVEPVERIVEVGTSQTQPQRR